MKKPYVIRLYINDEGPAGWLYIPGNDHMAGRAVLRPIEATHYENYADAAYAMRCYFYEKISWVTSPAPKIEERMAVRKIRAVKAAARSLVRAGGT